MKKKEQYIKIENLSVSKVLFDFINKELLKGLHIKKKKFWNGFSVAANELTPKNKKLLEKLEKKVDLLEKLKKKKKIKRAKRS